MALGFRIASATEDERFLSLYLTDGKSDGNRLQVRDLSDPKQANTWTTLLASYEFNNSVIGSVGGEVLVHTNYKAPRYRVVRIDPKKPQEANWHEVLPESPISSKA
jgi:prolyl oligopeptidase